MKPDILTCYRQSSGANFTGRNRNPRRSSKMKHLTEHSFSASISGERAHAMKRLSIVLVPLTEWP